MFLYLYLYAMFNNIPCAAYHDAKHDFFMNLKTLVLILVLSLLHLS